MSAFEELTNSLDSENMIGFVRRFPADCAAAFNRLDQTHHPWLAKLQQQGWKDWLCLGMGGSAAGGSFIANLAEHEGNSAVHILRRYDLPSWWTPETLVVATSYSGNTEETIAAVEAAIAKGGTVVAICSGGHLAGLAEIHENVHLVLVPSGQPPRSAFGHLFGSQLSLAWALGLLERPSDEAIVQMVERLRNHVGEADFLNGDSDIADLAVELLERPIAVVAPNEFTGVAERMRNQINENSARFARVAILPEMNHNEVVAWGDATDFDPTSEQQALILITWAGTHKRITQRMNWFIEHLKTPAAWRIDCEGESLLEAMLNACIDMDWLSCALALLHGKDPSAIGPISSLKGHLSSVE